MILHTFKCELNLLLTISKTLFSVNLNNHLSRNHFFSIYTSLYKDSEDHKHYSKGSEQLNSFTQTEGCKTRYSYEFILRETNLS